MQKHKWFYMIYIICMFLVVFTIESTVYAQSLCLNETFVFGTDNGLTVANTAAAPFIEFNLTGSGKLEAYSYSGAGGSWSTFQWNDTGWSTNTTLSTGLPVNPAGAGNRMSLSMAYNLTGNTTSEIAVANVVNSSLRFYFWNGSTWADTNKNFINGSIGSNTNAHTTLCTKFRHESGFALIHINDGDVNLGYELIGTNWSRNDSIIPDQTGLGGIEGLDCVFNLTGHNLVNLYRAGGDGVPTIYFYNNTNWTNITVSAKANDVANAKAHFVRQFFGKSFVTTQGVTGAGTYLNMTNYSINFSTPVISSILSNITAISFGDSVATNVTFFNTCGLNRVFVQTNNGTGFFNASQRELNNTLKNATIVFNYTGTSKCNQTFSIRYLVLGTGNISAQSAPLTFKSIPELLRVNNSAGVEVNLTCSSGTNATLTFNRSQFVNITLNMSNIIFGSNMTCLYTANKTNKIIATNISGACVVELVGVNVTSFDNVGVFFNSELSPVRPGNLGLAIGVGTISTIIITYLIVRRRRTES